MCAEEAGFVDYQLPVLVTTLENESVSESSGLAISGLHANRFWTHNDSGSGPTIYCFDALGRDQGHWKLRDTDSDDWEDMSRFKRNGVSYLVLADVGDNGRRRKHCSLYIVKEPEELAKRPKSAARIKFQYEGGARDCEAIAVDVTSDSVVLVTKVLGLTAAVFELQLPEKLKGETTLTARRIGYLTLPPITGMDISPDGSRMILATYGDAYQFLRRPHETWNKALQRRPRIVRLPTRKQGEAICYGRDGKTLFVTSEKLPTPLWKISPKR